MFSERSPGKFYFPGGIGILGVFCLFHHFLLLFPLLELPLAFLAFVEGQDVGKQASGDDFDLVLRDVCVVDELLVSTQEYLLRRLRLICEGVLGVFEVFFRFCPFFLFGKWKCRCPVKSICIGVFVIL